MQIEIGQKMSIFKKSSGLKIEANILVSLVDIHYTIEVNGLFKKIQLFSLVHYIRRTVRGFIQTLFKKDERGHKMSVKRPTYIGVLSCTQQGHCADC